jgi:hypothetical protein
MLFVVGSAIREVRDTRRRRLEATEPTAP